MALTLVTVLVGRRYDVQRVPPPPGPTDDAPEGEQGRGYCADAQTALRMSIG